MASEGICQAGLPGMDKLRNAYRLISSSTLFHAKPGMCVAAKVFGG